MAQFRITKKFATDIKVNILGPASPATPIFDDWFVDVMRVERKKVAIITHAKSLLTFLLPYENIGGAKSVTGCIGVLLLEFLSANDVVVDLDQIEKAFSSQPVFCKTDNRKVLGHMNDFKQCVQVMASCNCQHFQAINWADVMSSVNDTPVGTQEFKSPKEIAKDLSANGAIN